MEMAQSGPILESKGMHIIFQKKGKKGQNNVKKGGKGQSIWKLGQKCEKFEKFFKKDRFCMPYKNCMPYKKGVLKNYAEFTKDAAGQRCSPKNHRRNNFRKSSAKKVFLKIN